MARFKKKLHLILYRKYSSSLKFVMMALCVFIVTIFLPKQARFRFEYEKGRVWMQKDLYSPYSFAIKKTAEEIEEDKEEVLNSVFPIYLNQDDLVENSLEAYHLEFDSKWNGSGIDNDKKELYRSFGMEMLKLIYSRGLINPIIKYQRNGPNYNFSLLTKNVATHLNTADVYTMKLALELIKEKFQKHKELENADWLLRLVANHLKANYVYSEQLTDKLEESALNSISTTPTSVIPAFDKYRR